MKRKIDPLELKRLYSLDVQNYQIAIELGCSESAVEKAARRLGLKKERTGPKNAERHPNWKGGAKLVSGYWYIYYPEHPNATKQGYVLEHRLVMEQKLGRLLDRKEVVHHEDGNRQNNDPRNLVVFQNNGEHLSEHFLGNLEQRKRIAEGMKKSARWLAIRGKSRRRAF